MRWIAKAAAANLLSHVPGGGTLVYSVQRKLTRSLPMSEAEFRMRVDSAVRHLISYRQHAVDARHDDIFVEFGAGWDLTVPLTLRLLGVERQILIDREALVRPELVAVTYSRLLDLVSNPGDPIWRGLEPNSANIPSPPPPSREALLRWLREMRVVYRAPSDARSTALSPESVGCVTSTVTLEHIPEPDIALIYREMFRILRPGGVISGHVDMSDHYSHFDSTLTPWNFLRFEPRMWEMINCDFLYQNRLRASAYVRIARESGFEVLEETRGWAADCSADALPAPRLHGTFTDWTDQHDLLATTLQLVAARPAAATLARA